MENIVNYFDSLGLDFWYLLKIGGILLLGTLLTSLFGRFIFGKKSALNNAVSSAIGILFIYALSVVVKSFGAQFESFFSPLPYVTISGDTLLLFSFSGSNYTVICSQVLSMIILAFLVNLVDHWIPKPKNIILWIPSRILVIVISYLLHLSVVWLFTRYFPAAIITYAPTVLLVILLLMLATGILKFVIGAMISTVHPIIGSLYTFFFARFIGRQITKAVLTTAIIATLSLVLHYFNISCIAISSAALAAYLPIVLLLIAAWYLLCCVL